MLSYKCISLLKSSSGSISSPSPSISLDASPSDCSAAVLAVVEGPGCAMTSILSNHSRSFFFKKANFSLSPAWKKAQLKSSNYAELSVMNYTHIPHYWCKFWVVLLLLWDQVSAPLWPVLLVAVRGRKSHVGGFIPINAHHAIALLDKGIP